MKKRWKVFALFLIIALLLAACGGGNKGNTPEQQNKSSSETPEQSQGNNNQSSGGSGQLTLATMPVGGSINTVGNALASLVSSKSETQVSVSPFAGLAAWGPLLNEGEADLGLATQPELAWGYQGEKGFEKMENMRMLVRGNPIPSPGFMVRADADIQKVADLKGHRLSAEYPGSVSAKALLDAGLELNGLTWDDVVQVPTPTLVDGANGIRDNQLDAAYGLVPGTPAVEEVHNSVGLRAINFLDEYSPETFDRIPDSYYEVLRSHLPGSEFTVVEPGGYITEPIIGVQYYLQLVVGNHLSNEQVYNILDTIWNNIESSYEVHPWMKGWNHETMFDPEPTVPYHDGAIQFFKDKGLWTDETEQIQQELLNN
jgi:hypothetical protein